MVASAVYYYTKVDDIQIQSLTDIEVLCYVPASVIYTMTMTLLNYIISLVISYSITGKMQVNSFLTAVLSCCTDEYAHTHDVSTYSVSSDHVSDSSSELRCLQVLLTCCAHHTYIYATCKRRVEKGLTKMYCVKSNMTLTSRVLGLGLGTQVLALALALALQLKPLGLTWP